MRKKTLLKQLRRQFGQGVRLDEAPKEVAAPPNLRLKPMAVAVHQALSYIEAWNRIQTNMVQ